MDKLRTLTLAAALLACLGCQAPQKTLPAATRPPEAAQVAPLASVAQQDAVVSREAATNLAQRVDALRNATGTLKTGLDAALAEADRLRRQKTATEKELDGMWTILTNEQARAAALFAEAEKSKAMADQHRDQLKAAEGKIAAMVLAAAKADAELITLRLQHDQQTSQIEAARATEAAMAKRVTKLTEDAALATTAKRFLGLAMVVLLIGGLIIFALKMR